MQDRRDIDYRRVKYDPNKNQYFDAQKYDAEILKQTNEGKRYEHYYPLNDSQNKERIEEIYNQRRKALNRSIGKASSFVEPVKDNYLNASDVNDNSGKRRDEVRISLLKCL